MLENDQVDFSSIKRFDGARPSILFDCDGNEFARFAMDRRDPVKYDRLPKILVQAFLAAEDHEFFTHYGISFKGIARSTLVNLRHWKIIQGAGTITQQVVRGLFLSRQRLLLRKIKEAILAIQLERHFTKEQIFELYVNSIYFGRGIYGVEASCQRFWNKSVVDISLDEAATLAAVAKSAFSYSPLNNLENSRRRRNVILKSMLLANFITENEYRYAVIRKVEVKENVSSENSIHLYIQERVRQWAERLWGRDAIYQDGMKIYLTIDSKKQEIAEKCFKARIEILRPIVGKSVNGGMISLEPWSGKIKVCIGGYDFKESQFNRAFSAVRQMGSSFKPIVYAAAMQDGIGMETVMIDEPIEMKMPGCTTEWKPVNWNGKFDGPMTLAKAISYSNNIITIKTLMKVGIDKIIKLADKFMINRSLQPYPSLALGTAEATVEENAAAFNVFANNGFYVQPYMVDCVRDRYGKKLWEHVRVKKSILDGRTNSKMVNLLALRPKKLQEEFGKDGWIDSEIIGKTGSTNGAGTTWYVGSTPELTTAIYVGRDDNVQMGKLIFGSQTAYPIWLDFYKNLSFQKKQFYIDPGLKEFSIDWVTGDEVYSTTGSDIVALLR